MLRRRLLKLVDLLNDDVGVDDLDGATAAYLQAKELSTMLIAKKKTIATSTANEIIDEPTKGDLANTVLAISSRTVVIALVIVPTAVLALFGRRFTVIDVLEACR